MFLGKDRQSNCLQLNSTTYHAKESSLITWIVAHDIEAVKLVVICMIQLILDTNFFLMDHVHV